MVATKVDFIYTFFVEKKTVKILISERYKTGTSKCLEANRKRVKRF